jgi:ABC-2 type transport system permease protein
MPLEKPSGAVLLGRIALFELRRRLRSPATALYFGLFFLLAYLLFITAGGAFKGVNIGLGTGGKVAVNAPYTLAVFMGLLSYMMVIVVASVSGQAIHQDVHHQVTPLFFTAPIGKGAYLGGRLLGALAVLMLIAGGIVLGLLAGSLMPFLDRSMVAPNRPAAYLQPYLVQVLPNIVFPGVLFFSLAALTRSMRPVYVAGVVLLIGYILAQVLAAKVENKTVTALLDPFGQSAFDRLTEYWSVAEKNRNLVPLRGLVLANRALWTGLAAALFAVVLRVYRLQHASERDRRRPPPEPSAVVSEAAPLSAAGTTGVAPLALLPRLGWLAFRETVKNVYFPVIVLAGVLLMVFAATVSGAIYGTRTYPVTYEMVDLALGGFRLVFLIIITLYAGELVWREREARADQIFDALPIPDWLPFLAKLLALLLVGVLLHLVLVACGIGIQLFRGYTHFELPLYAASMALALVHFAQLCALALLVQTVVNHRYVGYLVTVLLVVVIGFFPRFGLEHHLYRYATDPGYEYSDMNRFGPFLRPWAWFNLYWSLAAVVLATASTLLWPRGGDLSFRRRLREARRRLGPGVKVFGGVTLVLLAATGGFIYYSTNVLNRYVTRPQELAEAAAYERKYKAEARAPSPRIEAEDVRFDLYPERRAFTASGTYTVRNRDRRPIERVLVNLSDELTVRRLSLGPVSAPTESHRREGLYIFVLPRPLPPGEALPLAFELALEPRGFRNDGELTMVAGNGSFVSGAILPRLGYQRGREIGEDDERRKRGLPPRERMADLDDPVARQQTYVAPDADWVASTVTVCTRPDQVGLAPGAVVRQFSEGGRACAVFRGEGKVLHFPAALSAAYQVRRDRWEPAPGSAQPFGVDIEIHHHPGHERNVERMVQAIKDTLSYATTAFGPYPQRVIRIVEFPRYASFAQSLLSTIPYSEAIGFIAEVRPNDPDDVDYPTFVTAHEVGHQWWAHQVIGANVQGATVLSETLAEYTGLMVMKRRYGADRMKRFLRYDLDRYLIGRSVERKKELPLIRVEASQLYIHYQKGGLAMYALAERVGSEVVDRALHALVAKYAFTGPPYPTSRALIEELRRVVPADAQELVTDLFERITLYENRAEAGTVRALGGDRYEVTVTVSAKKVQADELGVETERPLDDLFTIGVLDARGRALHLEQQRFREPRRTVTMVFTAAEKPAKAGIDPMNALIDRRPDDNVVKLDAPDVSGGKHPR